MNKVSFRKLLPEEYSAVKESLSKSRSGFYGLLFLFCGLFSATGIYPVFKSTDGNILITAVIIGIIILILFLAISLSYLGLWRRRKFFAKRMVAVASVRCIGIRSYRSYAGNNSKYIYKFMDDNGVIVEMKDPHRLNRKPAINDRCFIVRFHNKYYSIYTRKEA